MKLPTRTKHHGLFWLSALVCGSIFIALGNPPAVKIERVATNSAMFSITVTNGATNQAFDLWRRHLLEEAYPWTLKIPGATNQTNFLVEMGIYTIGFFDVTSNDLDGDGVLNFEDGGLTDTNIGVLTTTILFPADGATIP